MKRDVCSRRRFLSMGLTAAAAVPLAPNLFQTVFGAENVSHEALAKAKVAIVRCPGYGPDVTGAFKSAFDLLGGLGSLVKGKTVSIKLNLTGTNFASFLNRPVGETYMT